MRVWLQIQGSRVRSRSGPILSWRLIMKWFLRSFFFLPLIHSRRVVVSYKRKYVHELLVNRLFKPAQEKSVVRWTDRPAMTIAVDLGRKATKPTNTHFFVWPYQNKRLNCWYLFYSLTRQTDRQTGKAGRQTDSSPLICIILCGWKFFFSYKNASR